MAFRCKLAVTQYPAVPLVLCCEDHSLWSTESLAAACINQAKASLDRLKELLRSNQMNAVQVCLAVLHIRFCLMCLLTYRLCAQLVKEHGHDLDLRLLLNRQANYYGVAHPNTNIPDLPSHQVIDILLLST